MTPAGSWIVPQPEPLPLPAPVSLLWALLMLTFFLHVIAMNLLVGGSVIALRLRWSHVTSLHARALVSQFVRIAPALVAATVTLGVAPLLFVQILYGRLFFTSSILMAWPWLAVVAALILVYYGTYVLAFRDRAGRSTPLWVHVGIVVGLAVTALVYTTNMTLMLRAETFRDLYQTSAAGWHFNFDDPTLWPRWLHMILGAIAVAGLATAIYGATRRSRDAGTSAWMWRNGLWWSVMATGANTIVGVWWMLALPAEALRRLATSGLPGLLFVASVLAALFTCGLLVVLMHRAATTGRAWLSATAMIVTVATMIGVRDQVRAAALERIRFAPVEWVEPQWIPILLFGFFLVAALGLVGWMVSDLYRGAGEMRAAGDELRFPKAS